MVISLRETLRDDSKMNIKTLHSRRRAQLRRLIDEYFEGNQSAFAREIGRYPGEISRWLKLPEGKGSWARNMSEASARQIEEQLNLPPGYLDGAPQALTEKNTPEVLKEDRGDYLTDETSCSTRHAQRKSLQVACCPHGNSETQCRRCALVKKITGTLLELSYEDIQTISKLVAAFAPQK